MKLKLLVVAAGLMAMPVMGHAQSMSKDSMMMKDSMKMKDGSMMKHDDSMMKTSSKKMSMKKKKMMKAEAGEKNESMAMEKSEHMAAKGTMSNGTDCPMKCPSSKGAAGLSGPQFLALQQELRDRGCGNTHVTGWLDAPTRHAIATCAKKMNVANKAGAVLVAMNIGYSDADVSAGKM